MEILLVTCKTLITHEEQIIALDEIRNTNSERIYNQGINSGYHWLGKIYFFTLFLLVAISNFLTESIYCFC